MSTLYYEHVAHVVKFVIKKKDGSGTSTYYLGTRFYEPDELFSGSPIVYPILVEPPRPVRSFGREVAILHTVGVNIYGKNHFTKYGESFFDMLNNHEIVGAAVTLQHYYKPRSTTGADASTRQTLEATNFAWADDILTVNAKDTWFKNKEISKRFNDDYFSSIESPWRGEYGGIAFGEGETGIGILVDAPHLETGTSSNAPYAKLFSGFVATSHDLNDLGTLYVRNTNKEFNKAEWVQINISGDAQTAQIGNDSLAGSSAFSLQANARAIKALASNGALLVTCIRTWASENGTVTAADGELRVVISHAQYLPVTDVYGPQNPVLANILKDPSGASVQGAGSENCYFQLQRYIIFHDDVPYFVMQEWSNFDDASNYIIAAVKAGSTTHYSRSNTEKTGGWTKQASLDLSMGIYAVGLLDSGLVVSNGTAPYKHAYLGLEAKAVTLDSGETRVGWDTSQEFKAGVEGLTDDGSGTYTGSVNAVITNPSDIIRFLLLEDEIGLGLSASAIDTTYFGDTRTSLGTTFNMSFIIDRETQLQDFIPKICRHSRTIFYKLRNGKLSLKYPEPIGPTYGTYITEGHHQHDLAILAVTDTQAQAVENDFMIPFAVDQLNTPKDDALVRRTGTTAYKAVEYLGGGAASYTDAARQGASTESQNLYGKKEYRDAFDMYPSHSSAPRKVMQYRFDRYHMKQKQVTVRVPLIDYYSKDFWDTFHLTHTDLAGQASTHEKLLAHNDGTALTCYHEGVPTVVTKGGTFAGEVVAIEEDGDDMLLTIESVSSYQR